MRLPAWIRSAAREWPLLLAAAGIASLSLLLLPAPPPAPLRAARRAAEAPRRDRPADLLRRGSRLLETRSGDFFPPLREGLQRARTARDLDGFDFAAFYEALRSAWERETDPARLARFGELAREIRRIFPAVPAYARDLADLWSRAGLDWDAAGQFAEAGAARRAAEAYARGGFSLQAADLFARLRRSDPGETEALYRRAESLMQAGLWEPEAMAAFGEYVDSVKPGDPLLPRALLARGVMQAELGRPVEALREFNRILGDPELGIDPRAEEWGEALLRRGRALAEVARRAPEPRRPASWREARQSFEEYLDRYAASGPLDARAVEAGSFVVRLRVAEGEWNGALERLDDLLSRLPAADPPEGRGLAMELRFLRGDLLSLLGRHEEAVRAFGAACRRHSTDPERLLGFVGRARALLRLGRRDEARMDCGRARAVYESEREAFDRSLAGRGQEYWPGELDTLAVEVR